MKIGITLCEYAFFHPIETAAKLLREDGYETVDYSDLHDVEGTLYTGKESEMEKTLSYQKKVLLENGIAVSQIHGPWRYPPRDNTPEDRTAWLDHMKRSVRAAACLGAPYVVVHPLMPFGANSPENPGFTIDINAEHYARLTDYAKDFGITVCLENMPFPLLPLAHVEQIRDFVDGLGRKNLKICLDTGHTNVCGMQPGVAARLLGDRLATLHVHDNHGLKDQHLVPHEGTVDWKDFAAALSEIGFAGTVSSEADVCKHLDKKVFRAAGQNAAKILLQIAKNDFN